MKKAFLIALLFLATPFVASADTATTTPDTTPPIITAPTDQTFATTTVPAYPSLTLATAVDDTDQNPSITYAPMSFPFGTTTVTWTAVDVSGNIATTTSLVSITDIRPVFTLPMHIFVATSSFSVMPQSAYPAAIGNSGAAATITYSPTQLSAGTTTIMWTATDSSGNSNATTSDVIVINPLEIDVPSTCTVTDTNDNAHTFSAATSSTNYLGICMLEAAKDASLINFQAEYFPGSGLFVTSINGVGTDFNPYLNIWDNEVSSFIGIDDIPLSQGDILSFVLTDYPSNAESKAFAFQAHSLIATSTATATPDTTAPSGGGGGFQHIPFVVSNAIAYLDSQQADNGTLNNSVLDTDWATFAYAAYGATDASRKLASYLQSTSPILAPITDYERHAMALEAMGINPYIGSPTDTITPIVNAFDGTQVGDPTLVNDDIFALFPLLHAGYSTSDPIIQKITMFILSKQSSAGSWDGIDMTAAAVQALETVKTLPGVTDALARARMYLSNAQQQNGGFNNDFSTSWAMQAIAALGEQQTSWAPSQYDPQDYLAQMQQADGGMESLSQSAMIRTWSTAYAIPAVLGKTWDSLLQWFPKPKASSGSGSLPLIPATLNTSSTTPTNATSTPSQPLHVAVSSEATSTPIAFAHSAKQKIKTPLPPRTVPRIEVPTEPLPSPIAADQTAAVANAPTDGLFAHLWNSIAAFFSKWL